MVYWCCSIIIASYYAIRGGSDGRGDFCGAFYVRVRNNGSSLDFGAALSLKLIASYYSLRSGFSRNEIYCGIFFVACDTASVTSHWGFGAALSLLHITMLVMEVFLHSTTVVDYFLFFLALIILLIIGILVLLLISSYYTLRGDSCYNSGLYCGCFMIHIGLDYDHGSWVHGAALLCNFILSFSWWFFC